MLSTDKEYKKLNLNNMKVSKKVREMVVTKYCLNHAELYRLNSIYNKKRKDAKFILIDITCLQMQNDYLYNILKQQY
jgi:hypothetical protein